MQYKTSSPVSCSADPSRLQQSSITNKAQKIPPKLSHGLLPTGGSDGILLLVSSLAEPLLLEFAPVMELLEAVDAEEWALFPSSSKFLDLVNSSSVKL